MLFQLKTNIDSQFLGEGIILSSAKYSAVYHHVDPNNTTARNSNTEKFIMNKNLPHARKSLTQKESVNPKERSNSLWCKVLTQCSQLKSLLLTEVCSKAEMVINSRNKTGETRENWKYFEKEVH